MKVSILFLCAMLFFAGCNRKSKNIKFYTDIDETKVKVETVGPVTPKPVQVIKETPIPKVEKVMTLNVTVNFNFDSDVLTSEAIDGLDKIIYTLEGKEVRLSLVGGCCPIGAFDYNSDLGQRRANAVRQYLTDKVQGTLLASTIGETQLVTNDPDRYYLNRRVVIKTLN